MRVQLGISIAAVLLMSGSSAFSGVEIIEFAEVQVVSSLSGVVHDPSDSSMKDALVEEFSSDWKKVLRSTHTDASGLFTLQPVKGRSLYYLQISSRGFNPIHVRVRIDRVRGKLLRLTMPVAT